MITASVERHSRQYVEQNNILRSYLSSAKNQKLFLSFEDLPCLLQSMKKCFFHLYFHFMIGPYRYPLSCFEGCIPLSLFCCPGRKGSRRFLECRVRESLICCHFPSAPGRLRECMIWASHLYVGRDDACIWSLIFVDRKMKSALIRPFSSKFRYLTMSDHHIESIPIHDWPLIFITQRWICVISFFPRHFEAKEA